MRSTLLHLLLLFITGLKICSSSVVFRIQSNNENVTIAPSYLFGTIHVPHELVWPYLSNETLDILHNSDEIWGEHDVTDPIISKEIYSCSLQTMSIKRRASLRANTWARFLNETKSKSNNLNRWRQWFAENEFIYNNYLWRNKTITNDTIFDHRIILEAYQRGAHVGSLETLPNDCFSIEKSKSISKRPPLTALLIFARAYNCEMIDDDFVREIYKALDAEKMKSRNERITDKIRDLLSNNPQKKYVFVIGAAHLFGNTSVTQMLQDRYSDDYSIEQIELASPNFPYQDCTDEEFTRLANQLNKSSMSL